MTWVIRAELKLKLKLKMESILGVLLLLVLGSDDSRTAKPSCRHCHSEFYDGNCGSLQNCVLSNTWRSRSTSLNLGADAKSMCC